MSHLQVFCYTFAGVAVIGCVYLLIDAYLAKLYLRRWIEQCVISTLTPRGTCLTIGELIDSFNDTDYIPQKDALQHILNSLIAAGYVHRSFRPHKKFPNISIPTYRLMRNAPFTFDSRLHMVYLRSRVCQTN